MDLDRNALLRWRRELTALKTLPGDGARLSSVLALRRSIEATIHGMDTRNASPHQIQKARLITEKLLVQPITLPTGVPEEVIRFAQSLEGQLWTKRLLLHVEESLARLRSEVESEKVRVADITVKTRELQKKQEVLIHYIRLVKALTDRTTERSSL